jgi:hypothetical protein
MTSHEVSRYGSLPRYLTHLPYEERERFRTRTYTSWLFLTHRSTVPMTLRELAHFTITRLIDLDHCETSSEAIEGNPTEAPQSPPPARLLLPSHHPSGLISLGRQNMKWEHTSSYHDEFNWSTSYLPITHGRDRTHSDTTTKYYRDQHTYRFRSGL